MIQILIQHTEIAEDNKCHFLNTTFVINDMYLITNKDDIMQLFSDCLDKLRENLILKGIID
jgi:hypothetical protein